MAVHSKLYNISKFAESISRNSKLKITHNKKIHQDVLISTDGVLARVRFQSKFSVFTK